MFDRKYEMRFLAKMEKIDGELREEVEYEEHVEKISLMKARASLMI